MLPAGAMFIAPASSPPRLLFSALHGYLRRRNILVSYSVRKSMGEQRDKPGGRSAAPPRKNRHQRGPEHRTRGLESGITPGPMSPQAALALQRAAGNDVVSRLASIQRAATDGQQDQLEQIENLVAFYLPAETFNEDGNPPPQPEYAWTNPAGVGGASVEALRDPDFQPPRSTLRGLAARRKNWRVSFNSSFFTYTIELINAPRQSTGIDPSARFKVLKRIPRKAGGRSGGRTYAFGDRWGLNRELSPAPDRVTEIAKSYGLDEKKYVGPDDISSGSFTRLPSAAGSQFEFYIPTGKNDPKFLHNNRRLMDPQHFDQLASGNGAPIKSYSAASQRPLVDRTAGNRNTAAAMGGIQAHELMGTDLGGSTGQLAKYEWCHLVGDGDGGPSRPENLVIGTNAVNTEQLALETGLRDLIPMANGRGFDIWLDTTAIMQGEDSLTANFISYSISLVPKGDPQGEKIPIHRQIMDAQRGTITESEFAVLQRTVKNKIRAALAGRTAPPGTGHSLVASAAS
jgi:hypothetical protein